MAGTIWIAEAPVPITATRLPVSCWPWSHWAEWNTAAPKASRPASSGSFGSDSAPAADTSRFAVTGPAEVSTRHSAHSESQQAERNSTPNRKRSATPDSRAILRR